MRKVVPLVALALLSTWVPSTASAWANAQVGSVHANVDVASSGDVVVRMELTVRVLGGWLTELELAGLDRGLVLDDATPPTFVRETGEPVPFRTVVDAGGRVVLQFDRDDAPRSGTYTSTLAYRASIAEGGIFPVGDDSVRYVWTFPAWAAGLDSVQVDLRAPMGAEIDRSDEEAMAGVAVTPGEDATGVAFALHRVHLPRSIAWPVAFTLPSSAVPAALRPAPAPVVRRASVATSRDGKPQPTMRWVVAAFVLVALTKRFTFARAARARGCVPVPLLPIRSELFAAVLVVALGAAAAFVWSRSPELAFAALVAIVALVAQRPASRVGSARLGSFRVAARPELRAARWDAFLETFSPATWFDATRFVGVVTMLASIAGLAVLHAEEPADSVDAVFSVAHALGLLGILFVVGSTRMLPLTTAGRLLELTRVARSLRVPEAHGREFAYRLVVHRDVHDVAQDARLRLVSEHRAAGLVRLDVALIERATLGGYVANAVVLVVVRQGSEAERILARALPVQSVRAAPGGRRARILPLREATFNTLERLAEPPVVAHVPLATRPIPRSEGASVSVA